MHRCCIKEQLNQKGSEVYWSVSVRIIAPSTELGNFKGLWLSVAMLTLLKFAETSCSSSDASLCCSMSIMSWEYKAIVISKQHSNWFIVFLLIFRLSLLCIISKSTGFYVSWYILMFKMTWTGKAEKVGKEVYWAIKGNFNFVVRGCKSSSRSSSFFETELNLKNFISHLIKQSKDF